MRTIGARLLVAVLLIFVATSPAAQSAVVIVTNTLDSGNSSLRDAIAAASPGDTIEFNIPTSDPGYDPATGNFTIDLTGGEMVVDKDLIIAGPSAANIAISGNHASRIFNIAMGTVAISNLSLIEGFAKGADGLLQREPGAPGMGGAVLNQGTLTIRRCTLRGNTARGGLGSSNFAGAGPGGDGLGGAIANQNSLSLVASTLVANSALGNQGGAVEHFPCYCWDIGAPGMGAGGAIYNEANSSLSLSNCTITANTATGADARILNDFTFAMHGAAAQGGGIANFGSLTIVHCTLANNTAFGGASAPGAYGPYDGGTSSGGSLYCSSDSVSTVRGTIFAPNRTLGGAPSGPPAVAGAAIGADVNGAIISDGHNLLGRSDGCSGFTESDLQGGITDDTRLDPKLGELANYGGPTETLPLLPDSPAIDSGDMAPPERDQRDFVRNGLPDIGAFEYQGTAPILLANISTRVRVQTGENVMIGGFIITGLERKTVLIRGIGPSLPVPEALADPVIELHGSSGELLATNDNWRDGSYQEQVASTLPPADDLESALWEVLDPGAYTVVVRGNDDETGIGLFEVYDLDRTSDSTLANISTRSFVETGDNVLIGGAIITGIAPTQVLFRAIGPSLASFGISNALGDPTLAIYDGNGQLIANNNNWRDTQEGEIIATGIPPSNDLESAIVGNFTEGNYTAIVRGRDNTTGVAVVEIYNLD